MKRPLIAILTVALLATSMLWAYDDGFRGYVKRYDNQQPVQGAIVIFVGQTTGYMDSTLTNKNGYYQELLPLDTYDITAKKLIGKVWWTDTETATLMGGWQEVDFFLHPGIEP